MSEVRVRSCPNCKVVCIDDNTTECPCCGHKINPKIKEFYYAAEYARANSTCRKVHVGAYFVTSDGRSFVTCNNGGKINCNEYGKCYKADVTGIYESCEETRPYCQSVHAEINMLNTLKRLGIDPSGGTLYVTRYPCRNCLTRCIESGIKVINFCGVSEGTTPEENNRDCFINEVEYNWYPEYDFEYRFGLEDEYEFTPS